MGCSRWGFGFCFYWGFGGYAIGEVKLLRNANIYVNIGGEGESNSVAHSSIGANGGGGFYVGNEGSSGVGSSGYIGNSLLVNKTMYCYNCEESVKVSTKTISTINVSQKPISNYAKQGNGYAKIIYIGN